MAKGWNRLKGYAIGCGGLLLVGFLVVGGFLLGIERISSRAIDLRERLESTLPDQQSFTPRADGTISADRLERFLVVRGELMSYCDEFTRLATEMESVDDRIGEMEASPEPPTAGEFFGFLGRLGGLTRDMLGVGHALGRFSVTRNEALLEQEMGLGEYTWIYVIGYYSWLGHQPEKFALSEEEPPRIFGERILGSVRDMVGRQLAGAERELAAGAYDRSDPRFELLQRLRREASALADDPERLPFVDGLPAALEQSLEPFRGRLDDVYCGATSELDFMRTEGGLVTHDHV